MRHSAAQHASNKGQTVEVRGTLSLFIGLFCLLQYLDVNMNSDEVINCHCFCNFVRGSRFILFFGFKKKV